MYVWNVFVDGKWAGTVDARNISEATVAATAKFHVSATQRLSITSRT